MKPPLSDHPNVEIFSQDPAFSGLSTLRLVRFRHRRFNTNWSAPITWELWQRGQAAAVLPYDPVTDRVVMIDQFRLPALAAGLPPIMREIPAGMAEPGEDAETTIRRELIEEAGIPARRMHRIGAYLLSAGASDEVVTIFAGEVDAPAEANANPPGIGAGRDTNEDIRVHVLPATDAIDQALSGNLPNSVATIALLWLAARRDWLRQQWAGNAS
jgi:ADP-ribose pyrophosphatase